MKKKPDKLERPVAPAVYRPQPVPKVLQKKSSAKGPQASQASRKPVAPVAARASPAGARPNAVAQLMESRSRYYGKLGNIAKPGVTTDFPMPRRARVERLYELIPEEEPERNNKWHVNDQVTKLLNTGLASGPPETLTLRAVEIAKERLLELLGAGGGDHGAACRGEVPKVIDLAVHKGYDVRDRKVLGFLQTILVDMKSLSYTTTIGNFKGSWSGGGF